MGIAEAKAITRFVAACPPTGRPGSCALGQHCGVTQDLCRRGERGASAAGSLPAEGFQKKGVNETGYAERNSPSSVAPHADAIASFASRSLRS